MRILKVESLVSYPLIGINDKLIGIIHFWSDEEVKDIRENKLLFERLLTLISSGIERTFATEAIRESEERYRHLYETATVGLFRIDVKNGKLIEINDYGARLIGFKNRGHAKKSEIITSNHYSIDDKKAIYKTLRQIGRISDYELIWKHNKGNSSYFLTSMILNKTKGYVEGSFLDITDRKLVEEALMYGEERFRNVISSSPYGIHIFEIINGEIKLSDSNSSAYAILKNALNSDIGLDMSNVFPYRINDTVKEMVDQVLTTDKFWNGEIKVSITDSNGDESERILDFNIFRATKDNIVSMFSDITERRVLELERAKMRKSLEEKNSELEQLLFVTFHDLRSPLVNILGFSGELEEDLLDLAKKVDESTDLDDLKENIEELIGTRLFESSQFIQKSAKKIDQLLKGLLKLSRIGRLPVNQELIDTNQLLKDILDTMRFQIQREKIDLYIEKLPQCIGDRNQLSQVFSNLLDNAIKYMKKDEPRRIKIYGNLNKNSVEFCVEDNGIGIRPEHQDKVFQIFHRLNPDKGSGYGLGMTIVQRIVLKHGGKVWIESEEGVGTKINIRLPFDEDVLGEKA
ncbi:MAG: PAS domain-containing sensor histidine kinase [Caldisericia bacterium]